MSLDKKNEEIVVEGAVLKCTKGTQTTTLYVPESHGAKIQGKNQAIVTDRNVPVNIGTFGYCNKSEAECKPNLQNNWVGGKQDYVVGGQRALTASSCLPCVNCGIISIIDSGQTEEKQRKETKINSERMFTSKRMLKFGGRGNEVMQLQKNLITLKIGTLVVDGKYGTKTKQAVSAFQKKYGLQVSGIADIETRAKIMELLLKESEMKAQATVGKNGVKTTYINMKSDEYVADGQRVKEEEKKYKWYFVIIKSSAIVRDVPSSKEGKSKIMWQFASKERFRAIAMEDKTGVISQKDEKGDLWIQVVYRDSKNVKRTGWVKDENVLPDIPIKTYFPEKVTGKVDGKKIEVYPTKNWAMIGDGRYEGLPLKDSKGRYIVAVGPKIFNPRYGDYAPVEDDDFSAFDKLIEVVLENNKTKKEKRIRCIVEDYKAHTYNRYPNNKNFKGKPTSFLDTESGIVQTGIRYPNAHNAAVLSKANADGSIIEFCTNKKLDIEVKDFTLIKVISNIGEV